MKKSSFIALIMGTISGVLFSLGMCMALLPEWNAFYEGIILGGCGLILGIVTFFIWCKAENKKQKGVDSHATSGIIIRRR